MNVPAAVSEDIVIPSLEFVSAAYGIEHILTRLQSQVICIVQTQPAARLFKLLWRDSLQRRLGRNGHENR